MVAAEESVPNPEEQLTSVKTVISLSSRAPQLAAMEISVRLSFVN